MPSLFFFAAHTLIPNTDENDCHMSKRFTILPSLVLGVINMLNTNVASNSK